MFGPSGVPSAPCQEKSGAGIRLRYGAFPASVFGCLAVLSVWWLPAGPAQAASYPPALGCAVTGTPGDGGSWVQGMGFRAGSVIRISVAGHGARAVADPAGSFEAWAPGRPPVAGAALTATGPGCTARGLLGKNPPPLPGKSPPANPPGSQPEPAPPSTPQAVAIPAVSLSHVPSGLFLGLAGAVLLAGAALTGLTGRWGHRAEGRPGSGASVSGTVPVAPDNT